MKVYIAENGSVDGLEFEPAPQSVNGWWINDEQRLFFGAFNDARYEASRQKYRAEDVARSFIVPFPWGGVCSVSPEAEGASRLAAANAEVYEQLYNKVLDYRFSQDDCVGGFRFEGEEAEIAYRAVMWGIRLHARMIADDEQEGIDSMLAMIRYEQAESQSRA